MSNNPEVKKRERITFNIIYNKNQLYAGKKGFQFLRTLLMNFIELLFNYVIRLIIPKLE